MPLDVARLLELAHDRDAVAGVADSSDRFAYEVGVVVFEQSPASRRDVEESAFQGEDMDEIVALRKGRGQGRAVAGVMGTTRTLSRIDLYQAFLVPSSSSPSRPWAPMISRSSGVLETTGSGLGCWSR